MRVLVLLRGDNPGHIGKGEIHPLQHCLAAMLRQEDIVGPMRNRRITRNNIRPLGTSKECRRPMAHDRRKNAGRFSLGVCGDKLVVEAELLRVAKPWRSALSKGKVLYPPRHVRDLHDQTSTFN